MSVGTGSPRPRCTVSNSVKSGRCSPARRKRSRSRLHVSGEKKKKNKVESVRQATVGQNIPHPSDTNLQDLLNAVDGGREQGADLLVVIDVVCVSQTHEEDVGWQTWDQIDGYASRLQLWRDANRKDC